MARLIHQPMVRQDVFVKLIACMQRRGRRAYRHIDMAQVQAKARHLPDHSMPPEIIKLVPLDGLLDIIRIQKSATPVATPTSVEEAAADLDTLKPSRVLLGQE